MPHIPAPLADYASLLTDVDGCPVEEVIAYMAEQLPFVWRDTYLAMMTRPTNIVRFQRDAFTYIYDDYASVESSGAVPYDAVMEARLIAAYGCSAPKKGSTDEARRKGWIGPSKKMFGPGWDKGHFIANSIGGAVDQSEVNVFVQRSELNQGRSIAGRRYREMEKYCAANPATFCFSRPIYSDQTARPAFIEFGVLKNDATLWVECFDNRHPVSP
jgi:hypothetical protein